MNSAAESQQRGFRMSGRNSCVDKTTCVSHGRRVQKQERLINGDLEFYDWDMGYICHYLRSGIFVIQFLPASLFPIADAALRLRCEVIQLLQ